jgi:origin recognition complex subunit 3
MEEAIIAIVGILKVSTYHDEFQNIRLELYDLLKDKQDTWTPLRSEDDVQNSTLRTTVVAQKVELSKQKSTLSKRDAAYTKVLRKFTDLLEQYFQKTLIDPKSLPFNEVFIYDLKSPHREVFTPRPRHAIERTLAAPHDYLDCDCCGPGKDDGDEQTLSATQPATAVLYQLYLESGGLINASDLWQAFQAVMGDERTDEQNTALFQRALAELKYLGLVKNTRKRVDHVAKVAWKGL